VTESPISPKVKTHLTAHPIEGLLIAVWAEDHRQRAGGGFISTTSAGKARSNRSQASTGPQSQRHSSVWEAEVLTEGAEVG